MVTFSFDPFPVLETERLLLRQVLYSDAEALFRLRSDERVMRYVDRPIHTTIDEAVAMIDTINANLKAQEGINWGLELKSTPGIIGVIGYYRNDKANHRGEIGYMLYPDHQGKGLMQEAITAAMEYGFKTMQLHTIMADINPLNQASKRILERNGFEREAYFRENYYFKGTFLDSAIYGKINPFDQAIR